MAIGCLQQAKRALVKVLLRVAALYRCAVELNRDSPDEVVLTAFKKVVRKAHPDKGGQVKHAQALNVAKEAWDKARSKGQNAQKKNADQKPKDSKGSKAKGPDTVAVPAATHEDNERAGGKRVSSMGVLLTYNGVRDQAQWKRFVAHVEANLKRWKVKYWCATLEASKNERLHFHLFLQFHSVMDRQSKSFSFEGLVPRADCSDLLGEGFCKKKLQESFDRGFFYCFADKKGTQRDSNGEQCTAANYWPAWTEEPCTYPVKGRWPENLFKAYKVTYEVYDNYLFACRDGVSYRKRNLDACLEHENQAAQEAEVEARTKRLRSNAALFWPFPDVPEAKAWLALFRKDALRYPVLVVLGKSRTGKTEWAQSLFKNPLVLKIGLLEHFPDQMRRFKRGFHDGVVLDDLRDLRFLVSHQEKVQGKYNALVEFASTPGGQLSYSLDLFATPVVATANYSTKNLGLLENDDFLSNGENRVLVHFPPAEAQQASEAQPLLPCA